MPPASICQRIGRVLLVAALLFAAKLGWAEPPVFLTDFELAENPLIVVGRWENTALRKTGKTQLREWPDVEAGKEAITELKVERALHGNLEPGVYALKVRGDLNWLMAGLIFYGDCSPAVEGVNEPAVWLLKRERNQDPKDKAVYLSVENYRQIQPLALADYFTALASGNPEATIRKLLASEDPRIVAQTLKLIETIVAFPTYQKRSRHLLPRSSRVNPSIGNQTAALQAVVARLELKDVRQSAVPLIAAIEGAKGRAYLRGLLADREASVRGAAVLALLKQRDSESLKAIAQTAIARGNRTTELEIIEAVSAWGDPRLIPALIGLLEDDDWDAYGFDMFEVPATKARQALHRLTNQWFPYAVERSRLAWEQAGALPPAEQRKALARLLQAPEVPIKAVIQGDGDRESICKITNMALEDVTIARAAMEYFCRSGESARIHGGRILGGSPSGPDGFVTLKPGESTSFPLRLSKEWFHAVPAPELRLIYLFGGQQWDRRAWIGPLSATLETDGKVERKIEASEVRWSNGNLKAKGRTLNGEKIGEWHYFNFYGNRIRIENHTTDTVTKCDPDAAENEGVGRREK